MAGSKVNKDILNKTLSFIIKLLNDNNIKNWFIGYGTLLGIVRDNSCIDKDDDIDIIMDKNNYDIIKNLLIQHNISFQYNFNNNLTRQQRNQRNQRNQQRKLHQLYQLHQLHQLGQMRKFRQLRQLYQLYHPCKNNKNILKTKSNNEYCTIDFYMVNISKNGDFNDTWEKVIWSKCYNEKNELIQHIWNEQILYLPANYEKKLINRYGKDWKIPKNTKGPKPRKIIL